MSAVTADEILNAVAKAYGMDVELVIASGIEPIDLREKRARLQARMVAVYLLDRHTVTHWSAIAAALNLQRNVTTQEFIGLALSVVGPMLGYDERMSRKVERAERRIDELHERRIERKFQHEARA